MTRITRIIICLLFMVSVTLLAQLGPKLRGFRNLHIGGEFQLYGGCSPALEQNLFGWWKADALTNAVNGAPVVYWPDSSGHNLHITLGDGNTAHTPTWTNSFLNGLPAVFFDGLDDYMTNACAMVQTNLIFIVFNNQPPQTGDSYVSVIQGKVSVNTGQSMYFLNTNDMIRISIPAHVPTTDHIIPGTNFNTFFGAQYANTSGRSWTNGVSCNVGTSGGTDGMQGGMTIGCSAAQTAFWRGYIMEMFCITNAFMTPSISNNVNCYISAKYGIF